MLRSRISFAPSAVALVLGCGCGSSGSPGAPSDAGSLDASSPPVSDGSTADVPLLDHASSDSSAPPDAEAGAASCSLPAEGGTGDHGLTLLHAPSAFGAFPKSGALAGGYVYFTENGNIKRVPTGGGAVDDFGSFSAGPFLVVGDELVYSSGPSSGVGWSIAKVAVGADAAGATALAQNIPFVRPMATDGTYVAWASANSPGVFSVALAGGTVNTVAANSRPGGLAVIGSNLYWADDTSMHVMFAPIAGGMPMQAAAITFGGEAASDGTAFYWADSSDGTVNRMPTGSTTVQTLYTVSGIGNGPDHIAVSGSSVYFTEGFVSGSVWRVGTDGSGPRQLACGFASPNAVLADAQYVYIVSNSGVFRVDQ